MFIEAKSNQSLVPTQKAVRLISNVGRHWNEHSGSLMECARYRMVHYLCVAICVTVLSSGWCRGAESQPPTSPSLSEIVLISLQPAKALDPAHYPKEGRPCLQAYLAAIARNSCLWSFEPPSTPEVPVALRRRVMAEQMVVILGEGVRAEAETFANAVPLVTEWEGMSEGPVDEANFVDNCLIKRPGTSLPHSCIFSKRTGSEQDMRQQRPDRKRSLPNPCEALSGGVA
jgi:hypothetical protein